MHQRTLAAALLAVVAEITIPMTARAIPGQTINQLKAASQRNVMSRWFTQSCDELSGLPILELNTGDHGVGWHIVASSDGVHVTKEYVTIDAHGGNMPAGDAIGQGAGYDFMLFAALYKGSSVAADWESAKLVASVTDPTNRRTTRYFMGRGFSFSVTAGRGLTIYTKRQFRRDLARAKQLARKCAADPAWCKSDE